MPEKPKWYVVYTKPRSEKKLAEILSKKKIEYFLPIVKLRKKWSDRYKWIEKPAFDSYVFVYLQFDLQALEILKIPYSVSFVQVAGEPATLSDNDIDIVRIAIEHFSSSLVIHNTQIYKPGEKILVKYGLFAGKEAVISKIKDRTQLLISFPALNKTLEVEMPVENIQSPSGKLGEY